MAKFQFEGVDNLIAEYEKLEKNTEQVIGKAIYNGAGVVAKAIKILFARCKRKRRKGAGDRRSDARRS